MNEISTFSPNFHLNIKGKLLDLSKPQIMGILNITPDSFFEGSRFTQQEQILQKAQQMVQAGAAILDIGGHSTRPNASPVSQAQELDRVLPVIELLAKNLPHAILSIDTFRSEVAQKCITAGAHIINDVSGGLMDPEMHQTVARLQVPYILMHMRGTIASMMEHTHYEHITRDILDDLEPKIHQLRALGVKDIVIDLGFGFSKTADQNYHLLKNLSAFKMLNCPILVGISRKSMIWRKLNISANDALNGTTVLNTIALQNGANILRVHDVTEAKEVVDLWSIYQNA